MAGERFSGNGHARHICRACSKLDPGEKEYRKALADLDRACRHSYPFIHKSRRKWFDGLAASPNEKIRKLHAEVTADMAKEREEMRRLRAEDERAMEEYVARIDRDDSGNRDETPYDDPDPAWNDDEIPF
jgi:hypothetical protein